ncbi:SDR family oxidoreductase (plasmid) [Rhizobium ruizarguesonis]|uniref:SDR family oxidoreductase n=1 Tax=Rhizobium ruizarguesonis TaxID=2081791 RepID=A0ABY1WW52_9HYPH|nr:MULTISPECIES: SDR family oxidoreductase [Rhizobium]MBY5345687.1 SDR family oxidoreductase [Rhizobium leguminosarum]MBY5391814.1 SDR family oxidoreductase [Rhizobium leguminosarum]MBY5435156.1 SDR family oxidoreductase [Rhizobium leguminosarum]NEK46953.1 NAD(P)H-binding protein [Rhizobium leguminosarum]NKK54252.1 NAD(P)H-binding protein [Rhizobium leguminosarum bv. viciae]
MITITAATGRYGRLVVDALLRHGVPANEIVAAVRSPEKAADLAAKGVQVREADYDRPETLGTAFAGADKVLLVPSADFGRRHPQMVRAVVEAIDAGVGLIAYASFVNTDTSTIRLGEAHKQTEAFIRECGVPFVMLRNGAYIEVYAGDLGGMDYALNSGTLIGAAGTGKISGASRDDLAEAAAVVLTSDDQAGKVYELGGTAWTKADLAAAVSQLTGRPLVYQDMPVEAYTQVLVAGGFPQFLAEIIADAGFSATRGDWYTDSTDLPDLLGRPSTPLVDVVAATLKRNGLL